MGTAAASAGAAGPSEGLRAGRSSGRTKPEYTAASGRHDHATFGDGPTRQSDDLDSEPDYLLLPTRHGPGMLTIPAQVLFRHKRLMELDELSGRITGRLGYTWPTTAYAIGGTATLALALRYSIISATTAARTRPQG